MDPANIKHLITQVDVKTSSLERNVIYSQKFFSPMDMIGLLLSNLGTFSIAKVWCCLGLYWFKLRVVDSRPSVLLHSSGGHNCFSRCRLQMFLKPQICAEYGNRTREHQSGHQSSYWLQTSVLNFSDLTRTGVTHSPPHPTKEKLELMEIQPHWD